ncbi:sugar transporter [Aspergillus ibericus CBS 121593]|uniref:Sugar transporter n=1 Tax=Aspergillus ibericus CBS 121593 TaxID=1448316 RepID=A0A395H457_9EURO|nr:sugar transporter [Aspergillus ibericus CBS 121593]RAL02413.1 sugar transporter [Aspergillus ibericus CBS 121593]
MLTMRLPTFPKVYNVYFVAVIATVGGMLFGFDISSMSAIIGTEQYVDFFDNPHGVRQGAINSALAAGSVVGSIMAGPISDKIGRRDSIMFACLWWLVGTAIQAGVSGFGTLMAGRVLNGVCVGITSSQVPVYLAEISKKEKRGSIIVIQQLAIEWGIFIMFFVGYGCSSIAGPSSFRLAWGLQFVPCVFLMMGLPFLPRSPRWLAKVDRTEEAITTLARIQAKGNVNDPLVVAEWDEITTVLAAERAAAPGWRKFVHNGMWRRTMAGFTYMFSKWPSNILLISSGIQYALFIVFTSIIFFYIDKTSRRSLLMYGAIGMAICHFVVGGVLSSGEYVPNGVDGNLNVLIRVRGSKAHTVIAFSYLLIIVYALTLAPVAWVYAAEVWSLETRASGMAIAATGNWLFNFALGLFVPPGFANITWKLFITFGVLCIGAAVQVFFTYPETCGKTIEEVEELFSKGGPKAWHTKPGHSKLDGRIEEARGKKLGLKVDETKVEAAAPEVPTTVG